jgi:hypothetical protein
MTATPLGGELGGCNMLDFLKKFMERLAKTNEKEAW